MQSNQKLSTFTGLSPAKLRNGRMAIYEVDRVRHIGSMMVLNLLLYLASIARILPGVLGGLRKGRDPCTGSV